MTTKTFILAAGRPGARSVVVTETTTKQYIVAEIGVVGENAPPPAPAARKPVLLMSS